MSQVICSSCFEVEDTTKRFIELPYVCALCEKDSALAIEQDTGRRNMLVPRVSKPLKKFTVCILTRKTIFPAMLHTIRACRVRVRLTACRQMCMIFRMPITRMS